MSNEKKEVQLVSPLDVELIAKVCHAANKAYCEAIGDDSQVEWDQAEQWQKDSATMGVNFVIHNQHAPTSATHDSWLAQKVADGWVYGEVKDAEKKTHPCMVEYDKLPVEQQLKDSLFRGVVMSFAGKIFPFTSNSDKPNPEPVRASVKVEEFDTKSIKLTGDPVTLIKGLETSDGLIVGHWSWAWAMLNKGYAMRLPSWKGYWKWDHVEQMIILFTKKGEQLRFNMLEDWFYTLNGMADVCWEIAEDIDTVELTEATMPFSDALRFIKKGMMCRRDDSNIVGVFIRPEENLPLHYALKVKSIGDSTKKQILGKFEKMHFGRMISCITYDGRIIGWNPTDDDLLSNNWRCSELSYDELLTVNAIETQVEANGFYIGK